jgi:hypothetical protein
MSCGAPFGSPATSYDGGPWALRPRLAAGLPLSWTSSAVYMRYGRTKSTARSGRVTRGHSSACRIYLPALAHYLREPGGYFPRILGYTYPPGAHLLRAGTHPRPLLLAPYAPECVEGEFCEVRVAPDL